MCGINGVLSEVGIDSEGLIKSMNNTLNHRGPDDEGFWTSDCGKASFGHTRLSILDISNLGHQPMKSSSGRYVITYNGEIYNFKVLRDQYNITTIGQSDTELLLELIQKIGLEETLSKIDGMFSFGLWDCKTRKLYLCRDRFGEKPLYYGWNTKKFIFSSEIDSLKVLPGWKNEIDINSLNEYQHNGFISSPRSIYTDIKKLPPASLLIITFKDGIFKEEGLINYWSLPSTSIPNEEKYKFEDYLDQFDYLIKRTVRDRMISDVPLGAFLSGGTDSSLIVSVMQELSSEKINTFTIGFKDEMYDEAPRANLISKKLGTNHRELYLEEDELLNLAKNIHKSFDEPFSDSSQIPTFLVSKLARQTVKVALSGDGGDEFFAGYKRYITSKNLWFYFSKLPNFSKKLILMNLKKRSIKKVLNDFIPSSVLRKYANPSNRLNKIDRLINLLETENLSSFYYTLNSNTNCINYLRSENLTREAVLPSEDISIIQTLMTYDINNYLPNDILTKVDRTSMSNSLEVRVPLLGRDIAEWSFLLPEEYKINKNKQKIFLKKYLEKYLDKELIYTQKKGFSVPMSTWLKGPLREWAEDILSSDDFKNSEYWNAGKVSVAWENHKSGLIDSSSLIWSVLNFQCWKEKS